MQETQEKKMRSALEAIASGSANMDEAIQLAKEALAPKFDKSPKPTHAMLYEFASRAQDSPFAHRPNGEPGMRYDEIRIETSENGGATASFCYKGTSLALVNSPSHRAGDTMVIKGAEGTMPLHLSE